MALKQLFPSLLAISVLGLSGCTTSMLSNGLPRQLDEASQAKQFAYFMGLDVEDQQAPPTFKPNSEFVQFAYGSHIAKRNTNSENKYSQAMVYLPITKFDYPGQAATHAVTLLQKHLLESAKAINLQVSLPDTSMSHGVRLASFNVHNSELGCSKEETTAKPCQIVLFVDDEKLPGTPSEAASWLLPDEFIPQWKIRHIHIRTVGPNGHQLQSIMPNLLAHFATNLPRKTWLYVAPTKMNKKWTMPYISDGQKAHFFVSTPKT